LRREAEPIKEEEMYDVPCVPLLTFKCRKIPPAISSTGALVGRVKPVIHRNLSTGISGFGWL
jgi:hypothetical protein